MTKNPQGTFPPEIAVTYNEIMTYFDYDKNVEIFDDIVRMYLRTDQFPPRVLELGVGTGHFASRMKKRGYNVMGIDDSHKMLQQAHSLYPDLELRLQDVSELDLPDRFNVIVSPAGPLRFNYYENERVFESYIPDWEMTKMTLRRIRKHLLPGGLVILSQNSDPEHPGFFKSTGDDLKVGEDKKYIKRERRDEQFIYKTRTLLEGEKELWKIEHVFSWKPPKEAEQEMRSSGLLVLGLDKTRSYHTSIRL